VRLRACAVVKARAPSPMSGVGAFGVGVGVVPVVFVDPPAEGQPHEQVAVDDAEYVVAGSGGEDLPVSGIVAQERELGEGHGKECRDQQLVPGTTEQSEARPTGDEQPYGRGDLCGVVARPAPHQPGLPDQLGQLRVFAAVGDRRWRA
jgi:hypothetical protein